MVNRKKAGIRIWLAGALVCVSLQGRVQVQAAAAGFMCIQDQETAGAARSVSTGSTQDPGLTIAQAAGTAGTQDPGAAGSQNPGAAGAQDPGATSTGAAGAQDPGATSTGAAGAQDPGAMSTGAAGSQDPGAAGVQDPGTPGTGSMGTQDTGSAGIAGTGSAGTPGTGAAGTQNSGLAGAQDPGTPGTGPADPGASGAAGIQAVRPEAGIIEVYSGFVDGKGKFWKMKSGSGFLIANKENDTYIVTNCSNVSNTPRKIKKFCQKNAIDMENMQFNNSVRVVITGDVTAEAEVVVKSAEKDYCVLSAANVVSQKVSLKLGSSTGLAANAPVYAYGFPQQPEEVQPSYSEMEVRAIQGALTQPEAYLESGVYLAHSAPVVQGCAGGPLLDADGYVIGLNCKQSLEDDTGIAYALPIDEISAVLDNFSIYYGSRAIDEAYAQLEAGYREGIQLQAAGGYKKASMETLEQALAAVEEMLGQEQPKAADLLQASQTLLEAKNGLVPKTKLLTVIQVILAVCDVVLLIWMLVLAVKNAQEKKRMGIPQVQPAVQGAGYPGAPRGRGAQRQQGAGYPGQRSSQGAGYPGNQAAQAAGYRGNRAAQGAGYPGHPAGQEAEDFRRPVAPPAGKRLHMIRQKTGQAVVLNKNQFIIGKSQSLSDFCISDNQTVSRRHAMLFEDNGGWYIDDLNSLNGTCVNGKKVVPGQAVRLKGGDEITLSDEAFLVQG